MAAFMVGIVAAEIVMIAYHDIHVGLVMRGMGTKSKMGQSGRRLSRMVTRRIP